MQEIDSLPAPEQKTSKPSRAFVEVLLAELPRLRGAAYLLAHNKSDADDLLQTAAMRALAAHTHFIMGTNMRAWLYRIMRNEFIDMVRVRASTTNGLDEVPSELLRAAGSQEEALEMRDVLRAINTLTSIQREAFYLCCVDGMSYDQIAEMQGCAVGTVKSRIARARSSIRKLLGDAGPEVASDDDGARPGLSELQEPLRAAP